MLYINIRKYSLPGWTIIYFTLQVVQPATRPVSVSAWQLPQVSQASLSDPLSPTLQSPSSATRLNDWSFERGALLFVTYTYNPSC